MTAIYRPKLTKEFRTNAIIALLEQISDSNNYYLSIGKGTEWSGSENNSNFRPPFPADDKSNKSAFWDDIIGYLKVNKSSVRLVMPRRDWGDTSKLYSKSYNIGDFTITNTNSDNKELGVEGYPVYRCIGTPVTGICSLTDYTTQEDCLNNSGSWQPTEGTASPKGNGASIDTGDGYLWEYLYTCPVDEISQFCTPEYIVVPTPQELKNDLEKWGRYNISSTEWDKGRLAYDLGVTSVMFYGLITDNDFRHMLEDNLSFRQIGLILNPYTYQVAITQGALDSPVCSEFFGTNPTSLVTEDEEDWKIYVTPASAPSYNSTQILKETGELLYMENRAPINRSFNQIEEVRIVLSF